jgi:hypothetical protein
MRGVARKRDRFGESSSLSKRMLKLHVIIAGAPHVEHAEPSRLRAIPLIRPAPPATFPREGGRGSAPFQFRGRQ